jgi:hypothetical protein
MKNVLDPNTDSKENDRKDLPNKHLALKTILPPAALAVALTAGCAGTDASSDSDDEDDKDTTLDNPSFVAPVVVAGLPGQAAGFSSYKVFQPALADMDGDGDLDLYAGTALLSTGSGSSLDHKVLFFRNTSSGGNLSFDHDDDGSVYPYLPSRDVSSFNPASLMPMFVAVANMDPDGDDYIDMFNTSNNASDGTYNARVGKFIANGSGVFSATSSSMSYAFSNYTFEARSLVDLDGDGYVDMVKGRLYSYSFSVSTSFVKEISYVKNDENAGFSGAKTTLVNFTFNGMDDLPIPSFADLDNDGDHDMFVITFDSGDVNYFENTGSRTSPNFVSRTENFNLTPPGGVKWFPAFGDMDGDGDLDAMIGTSDGKILYAENIDVE